MKNKMTDVIKEIAHIFSLAAFFLILTLILRYFFGDITGSIIALALLTIWLIWNVCMDVSESREKYYIVTFRGAITQQFIKSYSEIIEMSIANHLVILDWKEITKEQYDYAIREIAEYKSKEKENENR